MRCPKCGHGEDRVLDTRAIREGDAIRRRRECLGCQNRFTTYEYVEPGSFQVVKKDGRREPFQREKLIVGLVKACEKRPIPRAQIEEVVDRIETGLARTGRSEVQSGDIGARVLEALRELDPVAYVRFASVYLNFSDIRQFLHAIRGLPNGLDRSERGSELARTMESDQGVDSTHKDSALGKDSAQRKDAAQGKDSAHDKDSAQGKDSAHDRGSGHDKDAAPVRDSGTDERAGDDA